MKTVCVFGSGAAQPGDAVYSIALAIGRALAQRGWAVCTGGYGGVMEAASRGAAEADGPVIGVTCAAFAAAPNAYLTEVVQRPTLLERLATLLDRGNGFVVLPGATGTLLELAAVWEHNHKSLWPPKPIVVWADGLGSVVTTMRQAGARASEHVHVEREVSAVLQRLAAAFAPPAR